VQQRPDELPEVTLRRGEQVGAVPELGRHPPEFGVGPHRLVALLLGIQACVHSRSSSATASVSVS
jgi:hypothetical protein